MLTSKIALENYRKTCKKALDSQKIRILVCAGTGCVAGGSIDIYNRLIELCSKKGLNVQIQLEKEVSHEGIGIKKSGCNGFCELGPLIKIMPMGWLYLRCTLDDCEEIVEKTVMAGEPIERLMYKDENGVVYSEQFDIPFYKKQTRIVLDECGQIDAESIDEYIALGGYKGLSKALFDMSPEQICAQIEESGLRGRGGGGFPAGKKWSQVLRQADPVHYVVCNGDEGDPGAFMDRSILEGDPHTVLEAMTIAGYTIGANKGYIYVRAEYPVAVERLRIAIDQAKEYGLLGEGIFGTDFSFDIELRLGAGAFVCGEETALMTSIEGHRGEPRPRPPFPAVKGLFGKPTILNNVETYANVCQIILNGPEWFAGMGTETSKGTKVFALGGKITNVGLVEVPMGTTLREIVEEIGGGVPNGKKFKAAQTGGPSGGCIPACHIDVPIDFEHLAALGSMMGSGGLIVMDEDTCMVDIAKFFLEFTVDESCGKCTPCRIGTRRLYQLIDRITKGKADMDDIEKIRELCAHMKSTSLCALGQTTPNPVISTMRYFEDEYIAHVKDKTCPAGVCKDLLKYYILPDKCKGCTLCAKNCPVDAISGEVKKPHVIDRDKCIRCGLCMRNCKFNAVTTK